jgi:hypothetical protein
VVRASGLLPSVQAHVGGKKIAERWLALPAAAKAD